MEDMKVLVTGSTGLVGTALVPALEAAGHEVLRLVRRVPRGPAEVHWDPAAGGLDPADLVGVEAAVHLAGENVGAGRWNPDRKARILASRRDGTALLARILAGLEPHPRVLVSASAVGIYGDRGDEALDEGSAPEPEGPEGSFLAEVCRHWEAATRPAEQAGIRVVRLRTGVVLSPDGGALGTMLLPFRLGLGGRVGSGAQFMSWVALPDVVRAFVFALEHDTLAGAVNLTAPHPVSNAAFTRTLGRVLGRPTIFPLPALVVRLVLGQMGQELLLSGAQVFPRALQRAGFRFQHPDLEDALRAVLGS